LNWLQRFGMCRFNREWRTAVMSRGIALLLFLFVPLELVAQRYGRPDSAQNYGRVKNPHLFVVI
jgi:hypothetical protein